jgi:hypothetical protein
MIQDRTARGKPLRWVAQAIERSGDLLPLGAGVFGVALIVAVMLVGWHERQAPVRTMTPPMEQGDSGR